MQYVHGLNWYRVRSQDASEVCGSRIPTNQEVELGSCTAERLVRLGDIARILTMERTAITADVGKTKTKIQSLCNTKRALEANFDMLEDQLAALDGDAWEPANLEAHEHVKAHFDQMKEKNRAKVKQTEEECLAAKTDLEGIQSQLKLNQVGLNAIIEEANQLRFGGRPSGLYPWPMFYPQPSASSTEPIPSISISHCSLCSFGFPNRDIVVAGCMHIYHPWCAFAVFSRGDRCVAKDCSTVVHPSWFQSFGWGVTTKELEQEAVKVDVDVQLLEFMHSREEAVKQQLSREEIPVMEKRDEKGMILRTRSDGRVMKMINV